MNSYPSVLLSVRKCRTGLVTDIGAKATPAEPGSLVVEEFGRQWPLPVGGFDGCAIIEWTEEHVVVRTGRQSTTTLYYWLTADAEELLIGTDLAELTARIIAVVGTGPDRLAQIRHLRRSIRRIGGGRRVVFSGQGAGETLSVTESVCGSWDSGVHPGESAVEAGNRQIAALRRAIGSAGDPRPVTAVVSGGVDSALVAVLAQQAGILDHLATLGTPWGDEYASADELGAHLGMPVQHVALSAEEILRALPETVRMLGEPGREIVAGGVGLVAVYRQRKIPVGTVLTGVGSDVINSGLRVDAGPVPDLHHAVTELLADPSLARELSGVAAAAHGYVLRHMYWDPAVIQAALDTAPEVMRYRDREKGHIRAAASALLPDVVAWRRKQALHHGTGIERSLDGAVAGLLGVHAVDVERFYELIHAELVDALVAAPDAPIDTDTCLDAATSAYLRENY
ncbi:asparagine synthase C-terminal domain-containing protein [Nocardia sp. NPDC056064]|uniref:asparagine synthase C-terminal domain-containing protein n=1 Tax=Nocardia sp. NPDC056064 TaxID=3345701 RepID=UPI0035DFB2EA